MKNIINKIISKVFGKPRKFFPVVDEKGFAEKPRKFFPVVDEKGFVEKPRKFFPVSEREYLLTMRRQGCYGNGACSEAEF